MKSIGFIIPNYPNEKRVALLPCDIEGTFNFSKIYIEEGFGKNLGIADDDYKKAGCEVLPRKKVFENADIIFSLKLIQPSDYDSLRDHQIILGWTHPFGSGSTFYKTVCKEKELIVIDTDSTCPRFCFGDKIAVMDEIPIGFCAENSYIAGFASCFHALANFGTFFDKEKKVAVLSSGNVSEGAYNMLSKLGYNPKMYYRKTMEQFHKEMGDYDIIVNGIELESGHIISIKDAERLKPGCLVVDAAADAGGAIEFTKFTTFEKPINEFNGIYYYCINNSPSILYKDVSPVISRLFSRFVFSLDYEIIIDKYMR